MVKALGIATLLGAAALVVAPPPARACAPAAPYTPPPLYPRYAVPPPAPPVVIPGSPLCPRVPVRVQCQSPEVPCVRVVYRYVCRTRTPVVPRCPTPTVTPYNPVYRPYPRPRYLYRDLSPYHRKSTPYLGLGGGLLAFVKPTGGFEHLQAVADAGAFVGWNFGSYFALELGLANTFFRPDPQRLGDVSRVGLMAVTLDGRVRLVRPSPTSWAVPFLQAGLGVYTLAGGFPDDCGKCKTRVMAHGGGVQAGGGVDFYLNRYVILGARVLYRHLLMSQLQAADGRVFGARKPTRLHGVSGGLTLTAFWSHL